MKPYGFRFGQKCVLSVFCENAGNEISIEMPIEVWRQLLPKRKSIHFVYIAMNKRTFDSIFLKVPQIRTILVGGEIGTCARRVIPEPF